LEFSEKRHFPAFDEKLQSNHQSEFQHSTTETLALMAILLLISESRVALPARFLNEVLLITLLTVEQCTAKASAICCRQYNPSIDMKRIFGPYFFDSLP
jgi:hypothetical protein